MSVATIKPANGGQLITRATSSEAGSQNYTIKNNFRRDLDREARREGIDLWIPYSSDTDYATQPYPGGSNDIVGLVHLSRRPDGESSPVIGTQSTIYRLNGDLTAYVLGDIHGSYVPSDYFETPGRWYPLASGFSTNGKRWEAANANGTTIFSNGYDLPYSYRIQDQLAFPCYELREQGILSLGTITEYQSILMGAAVAEFANDTDAQAVTGLKQSTANLTQVGYRASAPIGVSVTGGATGTATASASFFVVGDVGRIIRFPDGQCVTITGYTSGTSVAVSPTYGATITAETVKYSVVVTDLVSFTSTANNAFGITADAAFFDNTMIGKTFSWQDGSQKLIINVVSSTLAITSDDTPVATGKVWYDNPDCYAAYNPSTNSVGSTTLTAAPNIRQTRVLWSSPGDPTRFAATIPVHANEGSAILTTTRQIKSIKVGDAIAVQNAGLNGGTLIVDDSGNPITVVAIAPGRIVMSAIAKVTTGTNDFNQGYLEKADAIGSIIGYNDLDDDGSGILKMLTLQSTVIIYKDTSIFIGQYTGDATQPFQFQQIKIPHDQNLHYRNTLCNVGGMTHMYAGKNAFYTFDLTNRMPRPVPLADIVQNLFYDYATIGQTESIFVCDNVITKEVYFVCPQNTQYPVLAYDYRYSTFSTWDYPITAGNIIKTPVGATAAETDDVFVMGNSAGTVLLYGLSTGDVPQWANASQIFYRRTNRPFTTNTSQGYTSTLRSGLGDFGDEFNEKHLSGWVLQLTSQQPKGASFTVNFYSARNQSMEMKLIATKRVNNAERRGLVPTHLLFHNLADEVVVTGYNNPFMIHSRIMNVAGADSRSTTRR